MAKLWRKEMVGSKIDFLVRQRDNILEQRNYLQTLLDEANEVLQLATSWLSNYDGANDVTFKDINKMIDDKLMFLSDKDIAVDCEKTFMPEENTAIRSLPTGSSSTDQSLIEDSSFTDQPLPADEQKAIANQVKVKQDAMAIFSKSTENVAVKQYKMVCQIVDDRLAPLEKLKDIFNENLDKRDENLKTQLDNVCKQVASILPKIAKLETERPGPTIGFSACDLSFGLSNGYASRSLRNFSHIINVGNHFNPVNGYFTAPQGGLYATFLSVQCHKSLDLYFAIKKKPCNSCYNGDECQCNVGEISTSNDQSRGCAFEIVNMKTGDYLWAIYENAAKIFCKLNIMFVCIKIG